MGRPYSTEELEQIFALAEKVTGTCQTGRFRREVLALNIQRRMEETGCPSLSKYLLFAEGNPEEGKLLTSALTIHTTYWFRESPHFDALKENAQAFIKKNLPRPYLFWSAACSSGEEVYSAGLVLEELRSKNPGFDYRLYATDIDPISVQVGVRALYSANAIESIPSGYRRWVFLGAKQTLGWMTVDPEIRRRTRWAENNLSASTWLVGDSKFDWIMCRNVLIYFSPEAVEAIVKRLGAQLAPSSTLCLGHSEMLEKAPKGFHFLGIGCYTNRIPAAPDVLSGKKTFRARSVLIVDDSRVIRKIIRTLFSRAGFDVTEADSAAAADRALVNKRFDLVTLDIHMPKEDGPTWIKRARKAGLHCPVIVVTDADSREASEVLGALEDGAQDYVLKSHLNDNPHDLVHRSIAMIQHFDTEKNKRQEFKQKWTD